MPTKVRVVGVGPSNNAMVLSMDVRRLAVERVGGCDSNVGWAREYLVENSL